MFFLLLLILPGVRSQNPTVQSYSPRPQPLPFNAVQFLQNEQAKQGPILFPNDAPPPPPTPLIVTSRPLSESIARSELNPNNSLAAQSQYHQVTYKPSYLARGKTYEPYSYTLSTVSPVYDYESKIDYSDAATVQRRTENFYKDYEKELMDFIHPVKQDSKRSGVTLVQDIRRTKPDQPKLGPIKRKTDDGDTTKTRKDSNALFNQKGYFNTNDSYSEDEEFSEEDNNFDFDFTKLRTKNIEPNSSEYLEYNSESKQNQRRQLSMVINKKAYKIRPMESLHKESNGDGWHRLSDHVPSNSAEEIEEIIGLPPRRSVMRNIKFSKIDARKVVNYNERDGGRNKPFYNSRIKEKPQLRVVKPLHEFANVQRQQQNVAPKADPYKFKPYHTKNNEDELDYNKDSTHADNYAFSYTVKDHKTGDDFSHSQKSTGSATNGEYRVRLPDGRTQIVSYTADENGYKADVRYDEQHNQDNSIDFENEKDKQFQNNERPTTFYYKAENDHVAHDDSLENEEFSPRSYKPILKTYKAPNNYEQPQFENVNDYGNKNDKSFYYNVYPTKTAFAETTGANINDRRFDGLSDNNKDYLEHYNTRLENKDNIDRPKVDYQFSDEVVDFSSEQYHTYQPHKSKFSSFANNQNTQGQAQVRPSYDELKDLFVTNANGRRNAAISALPVVSTVRPVYPVTPENIVAITPKKPVNNLYTNINNIVSATPTPFLFSTPSPSTPKSYLLSTIANLKHQISLANKPVLSDHYINKINKYLSYSNPSKLSK